MFFNEKFIQIFDHVFRKYGRTPISKEIDIQKSLLNIKEKYDNNKLMYHNWNHISNSITQLIFINHYINNPYLDYMFTAILFHDIIYIPLRIDNEEQSAYYFEGWALDRGLKLSFIKRVCDLIQSTDHTENDHINNIYKDDLHFQEALNIVRDIDLVGLGAHPDLFWDNLHAIRKEYPTISDSEFHNVHMRIMENFFSRPRIYLTDYMYQYREIQARTNIQEYLDMKGWRYED